MTRQAQTTRRCSTPSCSQQAWPAMGLDTLQPPKHLIEPLTSKPNSNSTSRSSGLKRRGRHAEVRVLTQMWAIYAKERAVTERMQAIVYHSSLQHPRAHQPSFLLGAWQNRQMPQEQHIIIQTSVWHTIPHCRHQCHHRHQTTHGKVEKSL